MKPTQLETLAVDNPEWNVCNRMLFVSFSSYEQSAISMRSIGAVLMQLLRRCIFLPAAAGITQRIRIALAAISLTVNRDVYYGVLYLQDDCTFRVMLLAA